MAQIARRPFWRHLRTDPSMYALHYRKGKLVAAGRGTAFRFRPLVTGVAEIPVDDRALPFLFHGRTQDFQETTTQGTITYRITDPEELAKRIDFTIDLDTGLWKRAPLQQLELLITQMAQQLALTWFTGAQLGAVLAAGVDEATRRIWTGLSADPRLAEMGIAVTGVRVEAVRPTAELEKALQMPVREAIQQQADEATFQRRALAVESERAIQENELQNRIEIARREEELVAQRGQNARREATEAAETQRIAAEAAAGRELIQAGATAGRERVEAAGTAERIRAVKGAENEAEATRIGIYENVAPQILLGLAARELAGKLQRIDHVNVTPDMLAPLLGDLLEAGTRRLEQD